MSIEIMLNAVNLAIVAFGAFTTGDRGPGLDDRPLRHRGRRGRSHGRARHRHRHLPQSEDAARRRVRVDAGMSARPCDRTSSSARRGGPAASAACRPRAEAQEQRAGHRPVAPPAGAAPGGLPAHRPRRPATGERPWIIAVAAILVATAIATYLAFGASRGSGESGIGLHALHLDPGRRPPGRGRLPLRQPDRGHAHRRHLDRRARARLQHRLHGPRPRSLALLRLPQPLHVLHAPARPRGRLPRHLRGLGARGPVESYLLIGFWYTRRAPALASKKAFLVNRVADQGFLIGIIGVFLITGTAERPGLVRALRDGRPARPQHRGACCSSSAPPASPPSSRSTSGCPTPWRARRRSRRSSTPRRWSTPASTSSRARHRSSPRPRDAHHRGLDRHLHGHPRGLDRADPERHQARAGVLDAQPARLHVRGPRRGRLRGRHLPPHGPRLHEGPPVPRLGLGHPRRRRRAGHGPHGRAVAAHPHHALDVPHRRAVAGGHPAAGGLLLEGRRPGRVVPPRLPAGSSSSASSSPA